MRARADGQPLPAVPPTVVVIETEVIGGGV
jgi:hypothetical protein